MISKIVKPEKFAPVVNVYCVFDKLGETMFPPFTNPSDIEACRIFAHMFTQRPDMVVGEFALLKVGTFDNSTGGLVPSEIVELDASAFIKTEK